MKAEHTCWWCGKAAPDGVCMGPHPGFKRQSKRYNQNVENVMSGRKQRAECSVVWSRDVPDYAVPAFTRRSLTHCPDCGRRLTRDPLGDWCERCVRVAVMDTWQKRNGSSRWIRVRCECCGVSDGAWAIEGVRFPQGSQMAVRCFACRMGCTPQMPCEVAS